MERILLRLKNPVSLTGTCEVTQTQQRRGNYITTSSLSKFLIENSNNMKKFDDTYTWRRDALKTNLPPNSKYLILFLSIYMDKHGNKCFPSLHEISELTGMARSTVHKHLILLKDKGWIYTKYKQGKGRWAHCQYFPVYPNNHSDVRQTYNKPDVMYDKKTVMYGKQSNDVRQTDPIYPLPIHKDNVRLTDIKDPEFLKKNLIKEKTTIRNNKTVTEIMEEKIQETFKTMDMKQIN